MPWFYLNPAKIRPNPAKRLKRRRTTRSWNQREAEIKLQKQWQSLPLAAMGKPYSGGQVRARRSSGKLFAIDLGMEEALEDTAVPNLIGGWLPDGVVWKRDPCVRQPGMPRAVFKNDFVSLYSELRLPPLLGPVASGRASISMSNDLTSVSTSPCHISGRHRRPCDRVC